MPAPAVIYPLSVAIAASASAPLLGSIDVNQALATVGIIIALVTAIVAGYYTVKAKRAEVWRDTAEGYKTQSEERGAALERKLAEVEKLTALLHEKDIQIAKLEAKPNVDGIAEQLAAATARTSEEHGRILTVLEQIATGLSRRDPPAST